MTKAKTIIAAASALIFALAGCSVLNNPTQTDLTETTAKPDTTELPETTVRTAPPSDTTTEDKGYREYDYSLPVPENTPVSREYFDDAVFLGNSRTRGFLTLAGLSKSEAYAYVGLTVKSVFTEPMVPMGDTKITVVDALRDKDDWTKVYIMFGTNEIGWTNNSFFVSKYGDIIDEIRSINPDARIYIQSVLPVGSMYTPEHPDYYMYNMPKINTYNALLRELAKEKKVYFVDVAEVMTDKDGFLFSDASNDGVHLKREYCERWLEYLMCHTAEVPQ